MFLLIRLAQGEREASKLTWRLPAVFRQPALVPFSQCEEPFPDVGIRLLGQLADQRELLLQKLRVRHLRSESNPSRILPSYADLFRIFWYVRYFNPNRRSTQPRTNSTSSVTAIAAATSSQAPSAQAIPRPAAIQTVAAVVRP